MAKGSKDTNIIGERGEHLAVIRLTQEQLFDVIAIGAKALALDLLCRINDENKPYQFLVQVNVEISVTASGVRIPCPPP